MCSESGGGDDNGPVADARVFTRSYVRRRDEIYDVLDTNPFDSPAKRTPIEHLLRLRVSSLHQSTLQF